MTKRMNKIEKLIEDLCPDGVEFKELSEVVKVLRGKRLTKSQLSDDEEYPVYHGGLEPLGHYGQSNRIANTVMVINVGASAGTVGYSFVDFWSSDGCFCIEHSDLLISRYVYYALLCHENILRSKVRFAGIPTLDATAVENIKIPIPPLAIQQEIVKILDNFIQLESELESELEARKKQYAYCREKLLTFDDEVDWMTLKDVCKSISAGGDLPKNYLKGQNEPTPDFPFPIYSNGTEEKALYGYTDDYRIDSEAVTISARGTIGYHAVRSPKFTPIVRLLVLIPKKNIATPQFLSFVLDITEIGHSGGSIPQLTVPNVKKIKIPIPPLSEQEHIVDILNKFDALVNDISIGLPAELNARRKQYEYYREQLLTFKPLEKQNAN